MSSDRMFFWMVVLVIWVLVGAVTTSWMSRRYYYHRNNKLAWTFTSLMIVVVWPLVWANIWFDANFPHERDED